jgi:hypothetical protein
MANIKNIINRFRYSHLINMLRNLEKVHVNIMLAYTKTEMKSIFRYVCKFFNGSFNTSFNIYRFQNSLSNNNDNNNTTWDKSEILKVSHINMKAGIKIF